METDVLWLNLILGVKLPNVVRSFCECVSLHDIPGVNSVDSNLHQGNQICALNVI